MENFVLDMFNQYGYVALFFLLALGIIGLPVPDEFLLTFSGYVVYTGEISFTLTFCTAFLGTATGSTINYWLGRRYGLPLLLKFGPKIHISAKKIELTQRYFQRFGKPLIAFGYFIPGVRHLTAYFAGMSGISYRTFAMYAYGGAVFWAMLFISLGRMVGANWYLVTSIVHKVSLWAIPVLVVIAIGVIIYYIKVKNKKSYNMIKN
ncbi:alkaline phosphatase [Fictibacillus macauensis ZFHKF-1]|uniref:Alkaline phosphatase n=1 Tax=Fictibacillus macauensis ZFHKF-1 TaxID=1196324 RepID=I8AMC9_9BACL|nr:DedA family protein [Fictibacillus macauensis]EIT87122.1 alkaline phosphatase [Fictibacillus macauensis ZFHKF-1]